MEQDVHNLIFSKFEKYKSFINANGMRRSKAVDWAISELSSAKYAKETKIKQDILFQKIGWNNFLGLSFYISLLPLLEGLNNAKIIKISDQIKLLVAYMVNFTDIGNIASLGVNIEENEELKYARIDNMGNIFIFPIDAEKLICEIEENL